MRDNGTVLLDPLDIQRIQEFFASIVMQNIEQGDACLVLVKNDHDEEHRPALLTINPDLLIKLVTMSKGKPELESQMVSVHWYDTDPDGDFLNPTMVKISSLFAMLRIKKVDDSTIAVASKPQILQPSYLFHQN